MNESVFKLFIINNKLSQNPKGTIYNVAREIILRDGISSIARKLSIPNPMPKPQLTPNEDKPNPILSFGHPLS
jgi:hypothetical protein